MARIHAPNDTVKINMSHATTKEHQQPIDNEFDLKYELRHILRILSVFGLYHTPNKWQEAGKRFYRMHKLFCLSVQLILWLNVFKAVAGLWLVEKLVAMQVTVCVWWFLCATNASIWFYICSTDKLPNIFSLWQTRCQSSPESNVFGTSVDVTFVRRRILIMFGCAFGFIFGDTVFPSLSRFVPIESIQNDTYFLVAPTTEPIIVWDIIFTFSGIFANGAFALSPAFYLTLCSILSHQFAQFSKKFITLLSTDENKFKGCLMSLRRQHQYLSKAVFFVDDAFSFYLAETIGTLIALACFQMYQLVIADDYKSVTTYLLAAFWLCMVSSKFALLGIITTEVHDKAHSILNSIHDIGVFEFGTHEQVAQMNMFMCKLNGPPIALTLWNILPVTKEFLLTMNMFMCKLNGPPIALYLWNILPIIKEFLLTVVGVFITYFALVAQSF